MTCICATPTSTLAHFLRSIAKVDLPKVTITNVSVDRTRANNFSRHSVIRTFSTHKRFDAISPTRLPAGGEVPAIQLLSQQQRCRVRPISSLGVLSQQISSTSQQCLSNSPLSSKNRFQQTAFHSTLSFERRSSSKIVSESSPPKTPRLSDQAHHDVVQPAILELTPEAIENLAAEADRDGSFSNSVTPEMATGQTKRRRRTQVASPSPKATRSAISTSRPKTSDQKDNNYTAKDAEPWQAQKAALKEKFPSGWDPRKRLSPDALLGIRAIHAQFPQQYTTEVLAAKFEVSPEAIRRILKSKWVPQGEVEELDRQKRWLNRGKKVWTRYAALGVSPPKTWRDMGVKMTKRKPRTIVRNGNSRSWRMVRPREVVTTTSAI